MAASTGAWLAAFTVTVMLSSSKSAGLPLSVTRTVKVALPSVVGVQLKAPVLAMMVAPVGTVPVRL